MSSGCGAPAAIGAPPPCGGRHLASTSAEITRVCSMAEICSATFFQLADIAPPVVAHQHLAGAVVERHGGHAVLRGHVGGEAAEQQRNILGTLAQRRHEDRHRAQPVVKVLAETLLGDGLLRNRRSWRRRRGRWSSAPSRRAHADEFPGLQHPQQARLRRMGQLGHLVQEDRAAVSLLEIALAGFEGPGEGALLVAERAPSRSFPRGIAAQLTAIYLLCLRAE